MKMEWTLEYDNEEEIYTNTKATKRNIEKLLRFFDGKTTFYCCLADSWLYNVIQCVGEPDRRIVELKLSDQGENARYYVLARPDDRRRSRQTVYCGFGLSIDALPKEILTVDLAIGAFHLFFESLEVPDSLIAQEKNYQLAL